MLKISKSAPRYQYKGFEYTDSMPTVRWHVRLGKMGKSYALVKNKQIEQHVQVRGLWALLGAKALQAKSSKLPLDKKVEPNIVKAFITTERMIELLIEAAKKAQTSLEIDNSKSNAEQVALEMLEKITAIINSHIEVEKLPTKNDLVRQKVLAAYITLASKLGRNSPDALQADAVVQIKQLYENGTIPTYVGGKGSSPQQWVEDYVNTSIDDDLVGQTFLLKTYQKSIGKLYTAVTSWRSKGYSEINKFVVEHRS